MTGNDRYRVVAMIPTEIFVNADSAEEAAATMKWLFEQYPTVEMLASTEYDSYTDAPPKIMTVEQHVE